jgi:hypothetical protein
MQETVDEYKWRGHFLHLMKEGCKMNETGSG